MLDPFQEFSHLAPARRELLQRLLREKLAGKPAAAVQVIHRHAVKGQVPLSFAQQRLWFLDQFEPGNASYNLFSTNRLKGKLHLAAFERGIQEIVRRHEVLRATIVSQDGHPVQVIAPHLTLVVPVIDLVRISAPEREAEVIRLAREEAQRLFDLVRGPLLRVTLVCTSDDEYILFITCHHIIFDGWSMAIFIRELTKLYTAFSNHQPSPLSELPIQYADYTLWQQEWLQAEILESQVAYWTRQLDNITPLELPTDRPHPPFQTFHGAHQFFLLPSSLTNQLKLLSQREGVSLFMTLLAAFQTLLFRYTGHTDIATGTTMANRNRPEIEELIGFFINTVVMRTDLSGNPTFRELLGRIRQVALGAFAHQDIPFEVLVARLQPERRLSHSPLFQIMFNLFNEPRGEFKPADLTSTPLSIENETAKFDLTLDLVETSQGLNGSLEYNVDLFDAETISLLLKHWQGLLDGIVTNPEQRLAELPILSEAERHQLLVVWNNTQVSRPLGGCLHQMFEAQVECHPDAAALVFEDHCLTYSLLNQRANQLAHCLQAWGVAPEVRVGICVERSLELVIGLLGILKAGGAYVPLDPEYPQERLASMLESANVMVLVTQERLHREVFQRIPSVIYLDTDSSMITREKTVNPTKGAKAENTAYVIFTSGSTGQPKGAGVYHHGLMNLLNWFITDFSITNHDRIILITSLSFDLTQKNIFAPLMVGGMVCILASRYHDVSLISQFIADKAVTILNCTPSMFYPFVEDGRDELLARLKSLRYLFLGGEPISVRRLWKWVNYIHCHTEIVNTYGPTECTDVVAFYRLDCLEKYLDAPVPIGGPISNVQLLVLDENLGLVPPRVTGELYVAGDCVGTGYVNDEKLTATKFIPNPFLQVPSRFLYRTGDLARYRRDGIIEYLGRQDHQVKLRGFRIELGEIEATLTEHVGVRESVVLTYEDEPGDKRLVAYVVASVPSAPPPSNELRQYMQGKLPDYMVPSFFIALDTLPLTPSGKVDRRALPRPERNEFIHTVPARTSIEDVVAATYCEVLGIEQLGIHESFFELGGHSLLATQVVSRIRTAIQVEVPLRNLFEAPTVAGLARRIEQELRGGRGDAIPPIERVSREQNLPLSFAQQRLWFLNQLASDSSAYALPLTIKVQGRLDVGVLAKCLQEIVKRHECLRTTFVIHDGQPMQAISARLHIPLGIVDLQTIGEESEQVNESLQLIETEIMQPFDLSRGPLLRVRLLRLKEQDHIFVLIMHHIIWDAWSTGIFFRELSLLYEAFAEEKPTPLTPLFIQYADFALWQREWLKGELLDSLIDYWTKQLRGATPLELPISQPKPTILSNRGAIHSFALPAQLSKRLLAMSRQEGVTLFMVLLAAFQTLLYRYTGQQDIVVGTDIAGRMSAETEDIIGFFVNLLVLRIQLNPQNTFRETLRFVRTMVLAAYAHQDLPFEKLVEALKLERTVHQVPLVNVLFVLQNTPLPPTECRGLLISPLEIEIHTAKFDLALFLMEGPSELTGFVNYRTDLFDRNTIVNLLKHFETLLQSIITSPDMSLEALEIYTEAEKEQRANKEAIYHEVQRRKLKSTKRHIITLPQASFNETN